jgi:Ulp1 family protease
MIVARGGTEKYQKVYAFNTFFVPKLTDTGYDSVKRWTKKVDIFDYELLIIPVSSDPHFLPIFLDSIQLCAMSNLFFSYEILVILLYFLVIKLK